ncbi:MAG: SoxR reducing system RseC family protein [Clostridia bacterium]
MNEVGKVIKTKKKMAVVEFERKSACDNCHMCAFRKEDMVVKCTVANTVNAKEGEFVNVQMGSGFVLTAASIVYIIPLLLVGIGLAITFKFAWWIQLISVFVMLGVGVCITVIADRIVKKKAGFSPQIVAIVDTKVEDNQNE